MRLMISALVVLGALSAATPASAQTYGASYPVCLHVYGPVIYYECAYASMAQCNMAAAGRAAQCILNPYVAQAPVRYGKRARQVY